MEAALSFIVDEDTGNKLYAGEVLLPESSTSNLKSFSTLIVARNADDALLKLKAHLTQENPSVNLALCTFGVSIEYVIV